MRSGIMAATVPSSRVQIICRCNSLPARARWIQASVQAVGRGRGETTGAARAHARPLQVAGTEVGHAAARWLHELTARLVVPESHHVCQLVQHDRTLRPS